MAKTRKKIFYKLKATRFSKAKKVVEMRPGKVFAELFRRKYPILVTGKLLTMKKHRQKYNHGGRLGQVGAVSNRPNAYITRVRIPNKIVEVLQSLDQTLAR